MRTIVLVILLGVVLFLILKKVYSYLSLYNKFQSDWKEANILVDELKAIYVAKGVEMNLKYDSLIRLEKEIEKELRADCTSTYKEHLYDHKWHFIAYVGAVFLAENGGSWLIEKKSKGVMSYPLSIACNKGQASNRFMVVIHDAIENLKDDINNDFPLSYAYRATKRECEQEN